MIRLQRVGRKHESVFRLVLTDSKNGPKSGKYLEVLGSYDPRRENKIEQFDVVKIKAHISKGAQLSNTVHNFLVSKKVIEGKKINALPKRTPLKKEEVKAEEKKADATVAPATPAETAPVVESAPVAEVEAASVTASEATPVPTDAPATV